MKTLLELLPKDKTYGFIKHLGSHGIVVHNLPVIDWIEEHINSTRENVTIRLCTERHLKNKETYYNIEFTLFDYSTMPDPVSRTVLLLPINPNNHYAYSVDIKHYNRLLSIVEDYTGESIEELSDGKFVYL